MRILSILWFALLSGAPISRAQSGALLPTKEEAAALLKKAADQTNLDAEGVPASHLRMKTKSYLEHGKTIEGTYELWRSSSHAWREEISWSGAKVETIFGRDKEWTEGDDSHRVDTKRLLEIVYVYPFLNSVSSEQVFRVRRNSQSAVNGACIDVKQPPPKGLADAWAARLGPVSMVNVTFPDVSICLDSATGLANEIEAAGSKWQFDSYRVLGTKQFPGSLRKVDGKHVLVEAEVEVLEPMDDSHASIFVPSPEFSSKSVCAHIVLPDPIRFEGDITPNWRTVLPSGTIMALPNGFAHLGLVYFTVDQTGHTIAVRAFNYGGESPIKDSERRVLMKTTFSPATCNGIPVQGEYSLVFPADRKQWP